MTRTSQSVFTSGSGFAFQGGRHFLIAESRAVHLYGYDGRILCGLKWPGMRPETLTALTVSSCLQGRGCVTAGEKNACY